jgi:hypothetical protein
LQISNGGIGGIYVKINDILDLSHTIAKEVFLDSVSPWEVLKKIGDYILELGKTLVEDEYEC